MREGVQDALQEVLAIEREADAVVEGARTKAREILERGAREATALREELLIRARREAEETVASARAEAERDRERRLSEATREAEELRRRALPRMDLAIRSVADRLLGLPETEPGRGAAAPPGGGGKRRAA